MRFDRRISPVLLEALGMGGWLHGLIERRHTNPMLDVQMRQDSSGRRCWVSLYAGLSRVLDVDERGGLFRLRSHRSYQRIGGFDPAWSGWQDSAGLVDDWSLIDRYLDAVLADTTVLPRYLNREGQVHAQMCAGHATDYRIIQREAVIAFPNSAARSAALSSMIEPIYAAVSAGGRSDPWWPGVRDRGRLPALGGEADLIGVDDEGRLLVIEAKPSEELKGLVWSPAQVRVYAELFARLLETDPEGVEILNEMLTQRVELGLTRPGAPVAAIEQVRIAPVVAVGAEPVSPSAWERLAAVNDALNPAESNTRVDPLEVWILDGAGDVARRWHPVGLALPARRPRRPAGTFVDAARRAATAWKTESLPSAAQDPAPYRGVGPALPFCLPATLNTLNLLPDARETALSRFASAGIPWHQGIAGGPSNHLLSSQVQCANCLAPFVTQPEALADLFGHVLPIEEVLPFGAASASPYDNSDHVVFEWIGLQDYLGERGGAIGTRGANTTSADAAIRYRSTEGHIEIALIEWKYTEQYHGRELPGGQPSLAVRHARYERFWDDPDGPIRTDLIPYADLFVEPFYQLFRLQCLAWQMEQAHEVDAYRVRLLYVAPSANLDLATSFNRPSHANLGRDGLDSQTPDDSVRGMAKDAASSGPIPLHRLGRARGHRVSLFRAVQAPIRPPRLDRHEGARDTGDGWRRAPPDCLRYGHSNPREGQRRRRRDQPAHGLRRRTPRTT